MAEKPIQGEKKAFMTGNEVIAWAAVAANAEIMYGYPITPQNEIMHYWARLLPKFEKKFLQTEDELSAGFTTIGGVLAGRRAFTATAGPGNTLMQEPLSMAEMMRIPTVVIVQQRGGPSTATVVYSQQEVTLTTFGGNGEGLRIVYSPATHQDLFDYTIKAFNVAWKYRFPTFVLGDGYQAKLRESVMLYDPEVRGIKMEPTETLIGHYGNRVNKEYTHIRNCLSVEEELLEILTKHIAEYEKIIPEVIEYEEFEIADAEVLVISHGVVSRSCKSAVKELRLQGIKAGYFRPITIRPMASKQIKAAADKAKKLLFVESSNGQLTRAVLQEIHGNNAQVETLYKPGVGISSEEVIARVQEII